MDDENFMRQIGLAAQDDHQVDRPRQGNGQRPDPTRCHDQASPRHASRLRASGETKPRGREARLKIHPEHEEAYLSDIRTNSEQQLDLIRQIADSTREAAASAVEILDLLKAVREDN